MMAYNSTDLDRINDEMAATFLPVMVLIAVYMIIGLFGNVLVVYYYGCLAEPSPTYHFILAMAVFDLIICCISMPLEIVDLRYNYKFPSAIGCKLLRFVNYFASISSGLILIAIAVDRFRKVCRPFKRQITLKMAKVITGITCFASLCVSWPGFVIYDVHSVNISSIPELVGYDCTTIREKKYKLYITLYNGICFLIFIGCITTLVVLYIKIGRKLCRLRKFRFSATTKTTKQFSNSIYSPPTSSSEVDSHFKLQDYVVNPLKTTLPNSSITKDTKCMKHEVDVQSDIVCSGGESNGASNVHFPEVNKYLVSITTNRKPKTFNNEADRFKLSDHSLINNTDSETEASSGNINAEKRGKKNSIILKRRKKRHEEYIHLKKYTILMLLISIAFIVSFLPYLCLMTWRTLAPSYENDLLSKRGLVMYKIFLRSWLISSFVNPLIYGFFNADFKQYIVGRINLFCCKKVH